jgi:SAM-dependent methyltransferase
MAQARLRKVPAPAAADLKRRVADRLQARHVHRFPGHPVNVFMPHHLSQLQDERLWVTPKTDGTRWLLFFDGGKVYFANAAYDWFLSPDADVRVRVDPVRALHRLLRKALLIDGEWVPAADAAPAYYIIDVFVFRGSVVRHRNFAERFKFAPLIADALNATFATFRTFIKMFYSARDQIGYVVDSLQQQHERGSSSGSDGDLLFAQAHAPAFACDGIIFQHSHVGLRPVKLKEVRHITVDFVRDGQHLFLSPASAGAPAVYVDRLTAPVPPTATSRVVECRWDFDAPPSDPHPDFPLVGQWVYVRDRPHKPRSNTKYVMDRNVVLLQAGFTLQTLKTAAENYRTPQRGPKPWHQKRTAGGGGGGGGSKSDNRRYYADHAPPSKRRRDFQSVGMKDYHNRVVKDALYAAYMPSCTSLCELGVGRGADVRRILAHATHARLGDVVAVDVDRAALAECQRRWEALPNTNHLRASFCAADLADADACHTHARLYSHEFDLVVANFSMHYFHAHLPQLLASVLRAGGVFVATVFDRARVDAMVPGAGDVREFVMEGKKQAHVRRVGPGRVAVWMDSIGVEHEEDLVDMPAFVGRMRDVGFDLEMDQNFGSREWVARACSMGMGYGPGHAMWPFTCLNRAVVFRLNRTKKSKPPALPDSPVYVPTSPAARCGGSSSPPTLPDSPVYVPTSPAARCGGSSSPPALPDSPVYVPTSPAARCGGSSSPPALPESPPYVPTSPAIVS